jgi:hypothetical protein
MSIRPISGQELHKEKNMGSRDQQYIHNVARTMMGQLGIDPNTVTPMPGLAQELYYNYADDMHERMQGWSIGTLGRIASCGLAWPSGENTSLYEVHCGSWLCKKVSGLILLRTIATTAIIAAMTDLVRAAHKKEQSVQQQASA